MKSDMVKVSIERYCPVEARHWVQSYVVPREERTSVLEFLNYIFEELDPTLAYRRHLCKARMCWGCMMMINGRPRLACWEVVHAGQHELTLAPLEGRRVIRDLIVDLGELEAE